MRNDVKVLVLILIMSVFLRDTKGARVTERTTEPDFVADVDNVADLSKVTKASGTVKL